MKNCEWMLEPIRIEAIAIGNQISGLPADVQKAIKEKNHSHY